MNSIQRDREVPPRAQEALQMINSVRLIFGATRDYLKCAKVPNFFMIPLLTIDGFIKNHVGLKYRMISLMIFSGSDDYR
jgi:hypothetical protein